MHKSEPNQVVTGALKTKLLINILFIFRKTKPKSLIMKRLLGTRFFTRLLLLVCSLSLLSILLLSKCGLENPKSSNSEDIDENEDPQTLALSGK